MYKYIYESYITLCGFLEYKTWYRFQTRPSHLWVSGLVLPD